MTDRLRLSVLGKAVDRRPRRTLRTASPCSHLLRDRLLGLSPIKRGGHDCGQDSGKSRLIKKLMKRNPALVAELAVLSFEIM